MTVALYADYIAELRSLFAELDQYPERFQAYTARIELAAAGNLVVYETRRRKGQTDSLYYGRSGATGANQRISQATAFAAIDRFFALGEFVALTGAAGAHVDTQYPHCAVNISYRKKGQPVTRAMLMVFVAFNDEVDVLQYVSQTDDPSGLVAERPWRSDTSYEWT